MITDLSGRGMPWPPSLKEKGKFKNKYFFVKVSKFFTVLYGPNSLRFNQSSVLRRGIFPHQCRSWMWQHHSLTSTNMIGPSYLLPTLVPYAPLDICSLELWASQVASWYRFHQPMQEMHETQVRSWSREVSLEKEMATSPVFLPD